MAQFLTGQRGMIMDAKVFGYFIEVCSRRSLSAAARALGITPQGLGASMRRLESELGVPLLSQTSAGLEPTDYGELVLEYARKLEGSLGEMRSGISAMLAHSRNIIRLSCSTGVIGYLGEQIIDEYNAACGDAQVFVTDELPDTKCEQELLSGACDLALIVSPTSSDAIKIPLVRDYQFFWVNVSNPLSEKRELLPQDLDRQTVVTMNDEFRSTNALLKIVSEAGVRTQFRLTGEMMRVYEIARSGRALGLTCRNHIEATAESTKTVGVPFKRLPWGVSLCYRRDHSLTESEAAFVDYMRGMRRVYE